MDEPTILSETRERVRLLTLNRPRVLNAISHRMKGEFVAALHAAAADPAVAVVLVRGAGRAFCAGVDLKEAAAEPWEHSPAGWRGHLAGCLAMCTTLWDLPKPVVAAVHGHALGAGCDLAMAGDLTLAAEDARFGEPEIRGTSGPPSLFMPWVVGLKRAKELLLFGDSVGAAEAERIGIANRVLPAEGFADAAFAYARRLASVPAEALALNKRSINKTFEIMGLRSALDFNQEVMISVALSKPAGQREERARAIAEGGLKAVLEARDRGLG